MSTEAIPQRRVRPLRFLLVGVLIGLVVGLLIGAVTDVGVELRARWERLDGARLPAREAQAQSEIAQLGNAVGGFKAKCNAHYLPTCRPGMPSGTGFRLCSSYSDPATGGWLDWPEVASLKQLFPQMSPTDNGLRSADGPIAATNPHVLDPNQALLFFLTGSAYTTYYGFSVDRQAPFAPPATPTEPRIGPFLDVNPDRLDTATPPHYLDPWGTPYAYFAYDPVLGNYPTGTWNGVAAYRQQGKLLNAKAFQIISAGANRVFGPGGEWAPGQGVWAPDGTGGDDLSNFNVGKLSQQHK